MREQRTHESPGQARSIRLARHAPAASVFLVALGALLLGTATPDASAGRPAAQSVPLDIARIFFEYNASANDLGVHVFLDGEDWKRLKIVNPDGREIFSVEGSGPYRELGMTELFFEGAEPSLDEFPLDDLLGLFPEGQYEFEGRTVDGEEIEGEGLLTHAIPAAPEVSTDVGPHNKLVILWDEVTGPPEGFPDLEIDIIGYQVLVGSFQVTLPHTADRVTVPPEFVESLGSGTHPFEVLAIEAGGNQTIAEGTFTIP
ncbi:MAG: hypothetical protein ACREID_09975 [Planctomycetota bacterium]